MTVTPDGPATWLPSLAVECKRPLAPRPVRTPAAAVAWGHDDRDR